MTLELARDFIQKVKARCPTFTLTCVECQVVVGSQQELDQHRRETEETHMFTSSSTCNLVRASIFIIYQKEIYLTKPHTNFSISFSSNSFSSFSLASSSLTLFLLSSLFFSLLSPLFLLKFTLSICYCNCVFSSNLLQVEIFAEYLGDKTCDTCLQILHTPPSDGIHNCVTGMQGVSTNLNFNSFNEFVLRCGHTLQVSPNVQTLYTEGPGKTQPLSLDPSPCPTEPSTSGLAETSQGHVDIHSLASASASASPGVVEVQHLDSASTTADVETHLNMSAYSTGGTDTQRLVSTSSERSDSCQLDNGRKRSYVIEISSSSEDEILNLTSSACKRRKINEKSSSSAKKSKKGKKSKSRKGKSLTSEFEVSVDNDRSFCKDNNGNDKNQANEELVCLSKVEHLQSSHQVALKEKLSSDYITSLARKEHLSSRTSDTSPIWASSFKCNLPKSHVTGPLKEGHSSSSSTSSSSSAHRVKIDPVHLSTFCEQGGKDCAQSSAQHLALGHTLMSSTDASRSQAASDAERASTSNRSNSISSSRSFEAYPHNLDEMKLVLFVDLDNWGGFFKKLPRNLPEKSFVWGFYGGKHRWVPPNK